MLELPRGAARDSFATPARFGFGDASDSHRQVGARHRIERSNTPMTAAIAGGCRIARDKPALGGLALSAMQATGAFPLPNRRVFRRR
jgi:hypothetical protein